RELSIVDERNRVARDLHDSVTQTLFSLTLAAKSTVTMAGAGSRPTPSGSGAEPVAGRAGELRALVDTLRPPNVERKDSVLRCVGG
ncbi:MAG: histidine kinase dimerization/phosphoacceptor domain-containing protein, partial [Pseudonocardiaceae bacterium]